MSPDKVQARKMVLASLFVLAVVSIYRDRKGTSNAGQQGTFRTLWGVGVVGLFLSLLADFVPQIAGPFAGLVALGSITHGGDKIIQNALGLVTPRTASTSSSSSGSGSPPGPGSSSSSSSTSTHSAGSVPHTSTHPVP